MSFEFLISCVQKEDFLFNKVIKVKMLESHIITEPQAGEAKKA